MGFSDVFGGVGALVGQAAADKDRARARRLLSENVSDWDTLGNEIPTIDEQRVEAEQQGSSAFDQVAEDPRLKQAKALALSQLQGEANAGGMGVEDLAAVRQAQDETARRAQMARGAVLSQMAMRGQGGGGASLAAQLQIAQDEAQGNSSSGLQAAAGARQRALQAMRDSGTMAGQQSSEDVARQEAQASARDSIARFNTANRANANLYNSGLYQQQFGNRQAVTSGRTGARGQLAGGYNNQAQENVKTGAAAGSVVGGLADAGVSYAAGGIDPKKKGTP